MQLRLRDDVAVAAQQLRPLDRLAATCRRWGFYGVGVAMVGVVLAILLPTSDLWWTCVVIATGVWLALMGYWGVVKVRRQRERLRGSA